MIISICKALKLVWEQAKIQLICTILIRIILGLIPFLVLWVTEKLVNEVAAYIQNNFSSIKYIMYFLIIQFVLAITRSVLENVNSYQKFSMEYKISYHLNTVLGEKSINVPYSYFEIPEFHNHIDRTARGNLGMKVISPINNLLIIFQNIISLISYFYFLSSIHWSLSILTLISALPILVVQSKFGKYQFELMKAQTPDSRETSYITSLLHNRQSAQEIRIYDIGWFLLEKWQMIFKRMSMNKLNLLRREKISIVGIDTFTSLIYAVAALIVVGLLRLGNVSIGQFVSMTQAIQGAQNSVNSVASNIAMIYESKLSLVDLFSFLAIEEKENLEDNRDGIVKLFPLLNSIEFKEVSFMYPNSMRKSLSNVSFKITKGEKIAIVGENGSGKTTLIKCLMGLYQINSGSILFDNIEINLLEKKSLRRNFSIIFQDFVKYYFSIKDNIIIGDISQKENSDFFYQTVKQSGVSNFIERNNLSYNTYLGKFLKEGEELSGGQWQKVAIARSLFKRNAEILILDEPTSALDPKSELEIFERFNELAKNKTTIYVTHRMASVKNVDRILVMKNGELIETGNFAELMSMGGEFSKLYNAQARWYQKKVIVHSK